MSATSVEENTRKLKDTNSNKLSSVLCTWDNSFVSLYREADQYDIYNSLEQTEDETENVWDKPEEGENELINAITDNDSGVLNAFDGKNEISKCLDTDKFVVLLNSYWK